MTKEEAIDIITTLVQEYSYPSGINSKAYIRDKKAVEIAIDCIQHCIDEENTSYSKYISPELVQDLSDFIDENYSDI